MSGHLEPVTVLYETSLLDVPAKLRELADRIDGNDYGDVAGCTVVLRERTAGVHVCAFGQTNSVEAFFDLHAGARELLK